HAAAAELLDRARGAERGHARAVLDGAVDDDAGRRVDRDRAFRVAGEVDVDAPIGLDRAGVDVLNLRLIHERGVVGLLAVPGALGVLTGDVVVVGLGDGVEVVRVVGVFEAAVHEVIGGVAHEDGLAHVLDRVPGYRRRVGQGDDAEPRAGAHGLVLAHDL